MICPTHSVTHLTHILTRLSLDHQPIAQDILETSTCGIHLSTYTSTHLHIHLRIYAPIRPSTHKPIHKKGRVRAYLKSCLPLQRKRCLAKRSTISSISNRVSACNGLFLLLSFFLSTVVGAQSKGGSKANMNVINGFTNIYIYNIYIYYCCSLLK